MTLFLAKVRQEFGRGGRKREREEGGRGKREGGRRGRREGGGRGREEGGGRRRDRKAGGGSREVATNVHVSLLPKLDFPSLCRTLNFHYRLGASVSSKLELL